MKRGTLNTVERKSADHSTEEMMDEHNMVQQNRLKQIRLNTFQVLTNQRSGGGFSSLLDNFSSAFLYNSF